MPKPYWAPMSCYVVVQGMTFQSMWTKQAHRILGTALGLILTWLLFTLNLTPFGVATLVFVLMSIIETVVLRHYVSAVIFITPLTIFLAEYNPAMPMNVSEVISARFWDSVLGCIIGVFGIMVMLSPIIRNRLHVVQRWILTKFHNFEPS